jgi:hypothetical protein
MNEIPKRLLEIAQQLKDGQAPRKHRVRSVLKWFGASRRGANVLSDIKTALANLGLQTNPVLDNAGIDERIRFFSAAAQIDDAGENSGQRQLQVSSNDERPPTLAETPNGISDAPESEDQLEPELEDDQPAQKPDDRPVTSQSSDWTISALRDKLDRGQLDLQPKSQREYVWNTRPELPSRLIESLLLEIPIPPHLLRQSCGRSP